MSGESYLEAYRNPRLSTSTRLPIIRTLEEVDHHQTRESRAALRENFDPRSAFLHLPSMLPRFQFHREEIQRRMNARYAERAQQPTMSTYRGWAPGTLEYDRSLQSGPVRMPSRDDHSPRNTVTRRYRRELEMDQVSQTNDAENVDGNERRERVEWQSSRTRNGREFPITRSESSPLRTAAMMESFRRQARVDILRDRIDSFTGARGHEQNPPAFNLIDEFDRLANDTEPTDSITSNNIVSEQRSEHFLAEKHTIKVFEEAIILLDGLRLCLNQMDRLTLLKDAGFGENNCAEMMANDKTLDTASVTKPQPSSWLRPGASFSGQQKASIVSAPLRAQRRPRRLYPLPIEEPDILPRQSPSEPHETVAAGSPDAVQDSWPVKVTITSINYNEMTLTGTMEAFNVPNTKSSNMSSRDPKISSITTYLEGEVIDFHKHSLRTTNFKAGSEVDAIYWRKLEPFKSLRVHEIVEGFTDMEWLSENMAQLWVIMRWKGMISMMLVCRSLLTMTEKCFISPSDSNSGLTISGFYYIAMRRSDGKVEGLYHDPLSCPYQHLNLMPEKPVFPVYAFR